MLYNKNLITLKCVLFLFFGAVGALFPFILYHMDELGFSRDDSTTISIIAPLIATLGPLIVAPIADRLAGGFGGSPRSKNGSYLRFMTAFCMVFAALFYGLLMLVNPIVKSPPNVTFLCDNSGGFILQDKCNDPKPCYDWNGEVGSVEVKNCIFTCNRTTLYKGEEVTLSPERQTGQDNSTEEYPFDENDDSIIEPDVPRYRRDTQFIDYGFQQLPHMCYKNLTTGNKICAVYSEDSQKIKFDLGLRQTYTNFSISRSNGSSEYEEDVCRYPFATDFYCRITSKTVEDLRRDSPDCEPIVLCEIHQPYDNSVLGSKNLLKKSQCGYGNSSFGLYFVLRVLGDVFTAAVVALLATCVVIATRETSTGRGDVGKQLAAGALGFGIFPLIVGCLAGGGFREAIITFAVLIIFAVLILLFDFNMPLGPPEWWWHTRCGFLALPMSSVRKYGVEIVSLGVVLFTLGVFWSAIDVFLPWRVHKITAAADAPGTIGATLAVGSIPAAFFLIFAERFVDYCCHSNVLIICFVTYIIHHVGLLCTNDGGLLLLFETLEIFSLHMMFVTAVMYLRHLVPKKFTACGQALPVIAHFCIGRCIGSWLGSYAYTEDMYTFAKVHEGFAIAATVIAVIYFLAYHLLLKPKYVAPPQLPPYPAPSVVQSMNGNGSYTPLRVYHNGRAKKGHFRY